jgi:hypothetical protein
LEEFELTHRAKLIPGWVRSVTFPFTVAAVIVAGCSDDDEGGLQPNPEPPRIDSLEPDSAALGDNILILGEGFGDEQGSSRVLFGNLEGAVASWSDSRLDAIVPEKAITGPVSVEVDGRESNSLTLTVIEAPRPLPTITDLVPVRTVVGDTLRVVGTGFGSEPDGRRILFAETGGFSSGGSIEASILQWGETEVVVLVPEGAQTGDVLVEDDGRQSKGVSFGVAPRLISFANDLAERVFRPRGCESCHFGPNGNNGFSVLSPQEILNGGDHGPGAIPRRASQSLILLKVTNPPFGGRMPQGSPALPDSEVVLISDWINQGARDN